jgi:hypothetical protein
LFCGFGMRLNVGIAGGGGDSGSAVKVALFALLALFAACTAVMCGTLSRVGQ